MANYLEGVSPFVETAYDPTTILVRLSPEKTLDLPADLTASDLVVMARNITRPWTCTRLVFGDEIHRTMWDEYDTDDGVVDENVVMDVFQAAVEQATGVPMNSALGLTITAMDSWPVLQHFAGWNVDLANMSARKFCGLVASFLIDPEWQRRTEAYKEYETSRLMQTDAAPTTIRRKRRRKKRSSK